MDQAQEKKPEIKLDEWNPSSSSNLEAIRYDTAKGELHVRFRRKTVEEGGPTHYVYKDVPRGTFDELMAAPSAGKYFGANVQKKYSWTKVKEVVPHMDGDDPSPQVEG